MTSPAYRDLAAERRAAGDLVAARELERLAETPEATFDAARVAWEAQFGNGWREVERASVEPEESGLETAR